MKKLYLPLIVLLALLVFASGVLASPSASRNFVAQLSGSNEVPSRDTLARGNAIIHLSEDGTVLSYKLIAANINNVTASHIHCAPGGSNGPVGLTLFVGAAASGRVDGVLALGDKMAPDTGNGCRWISLDDVVAAMLSGNAYVNVHTNDGVAPTNTGPGDFPGGEIRGQISESGPTR